MKNWMWITILIAVAIIGVVVGVMVNTTKKESAIKKVVDSKKGNGKFEVGYLLNEQEANNLSILESYFVEPKFTYMRDSSGNYYKSWIVNIMEPNVTMTITQQEFNEAIKK